MAAASTDSSVRRARHVALARVLGASVACAGLASGAAALLMHAGFDRHATALWISALMLVVMMSVPLLMVRSSGRHAMLASAATLIVTISAINSVPAYLNGSAHGAVIALLIVAAASVGLLFYWLRAPRVAATLRHDADRSSTHRVALPKAAPLSGSTTLLALLAGLSSGSLARFQLFAICGVSGTQSLWQVALSLAAVCALACIAEHSDSHRMLMVSYLARAALIGSLTASGNPALAPFAAVIFLVLDCLTIPALVSLRGDSNSVLNASCPGLAHHVGMVLGAALSTTPYFFGDGFVLLYASSAAANVICAASLATQHVRSHPNLCRRQASPSS